MDSCPRHKVSRRDFLRTAGVGAAVTLGSTRLQLQAGDSRPLPQRTLGKSGVRVPVLGLGTAPAGLRSRTEAARLYDEAISAGVTYMDTAPEFAGYGVAQVALGDVLNSRRDEVFLVTKCYEPDGEKALALLKKNLAELRTDYADLVYSHSIGDDKMDPKTVMGKRGVMRALEKARADGLCRFVGVSGHNRPGRFLEAMKHFDVQVMMNAVNFVVRHVYNFEEQVWPVAQDKGVGLVAMKVFGGMDRSRGGAKGGRVTGDDMPMAFRYAMGLPQVTTVVLGCYDSEELAQAVHWARSFKPLSDDESEELLARGKRYAADWGKPYGPVA